MSTPKVILHHYNGSPYAERVITALRVKGIPWYSVQTSPMLPRPLLEPLTHGYRRIPVMQIGNNVYCDTAVILDELERRYPERPLLAGFPSTEGMAEMISAWVDKVLFANTKDQMPWGATEEEQKASPLHAVFGNKAFLADRAQLSGSRGINTEAIRKAQPFLLDQLIANMDTLESMLAPSMEMFQQHKRSPQPQGGWILGTELPSLSDVSVYSIVWWVMSTKRAPESINAKMYPNVFEWYKQMTEYAKAHRHPTLDRVKLSGEEALEMARKASEGEVFVPTKEGAHPLEKRAAGELVTVSPNDYGKVPVRGTILEITKKRVSIQPEPVAGSKEGIQVVMHFPRAGYMIVPVNKASL